MLIRSPEVSFKTNPPLRSIAATRESSGHWTIEPFDVGDQIAGDVTLRRTVPGSAGNGVLGRLAY
ncbi:hypothetical protein [Tenggerimyces flavus]|uniref:Uncharacterized protein n=1 Tax=Tenggerimyces flavus TaxID=1708749 RepID=A0ABV7YNS9_9ACTN|nr:hypothetical protein [Tenggerimyces flavus]MBM7790375.1 hypothetical protein [Tenggerimyces flavus]